MPGDDMLHEPLLLRQDVNTYRISNVKRFVSCTPTYNYVHLRAPMYIYVHLSIPMYTYVHIFAC